MLAHLYPLLLLSFAVSVDGFGVGVTYGLRRIRIPLLSVLIISGCSGVVILLSMNLGAWLTEFVSPEGAKLIGALILICIGSYSLLQQARGSGTSDISIATEASDTAAENQTQPKEDPGMMAHEHLDGIRTKSVDSGAASSGTFTSGAAGGAGSGAAIGITAEADHAVPSIAVLTLEIKKLGLVIQILRTPQAADVDSSGSISSGEALLLGAALSLDAFGAGLGAAMVGLEPWLTAISIMFASGLFLLAGMRFGFRFSGVRRMKLLGVLPGMLLLFIGFGKLW
ncbi:manganese efflux pump [Paenibacillus herberti]|uniref:Sporulation membrane protein YtaF n=1 Tax=Paenibacillus herberti TaxID=1619309 RepID=A0A229P451_9BACL|nr:manganese efflux pump [Paenibacillus herberti]OXM17032.1 sporulation membrane protein YtaF [Paenibacillus herberti]